MVSTSAAGPVPARDAASGAPTQTMRCVNARAVSAICAVSTDALRSAVRKET